MTLKVRIQASHPIPIDVEFQVGNGELLALVGPSGSGKTTILRSIAGLHRPGAAYIAAGPDVWMDTDAGIDLPTHRRRVGMVFQSYALFPHMTTRQNIVAAMDPTAADRMDEALRLLDLVGLSGLADRRPSALSGGQQQRVAVARALARRPEALLLDEPLSAVDRPMRDALHAEFAALRRSLSMPVIMVTHDLAEAQTLADRLAVIDRGRLVGQGTTAEVLSDPAAMRVLGLREIAALLSARVEAHDDDGLTRLATVSGPIWVPRIDDMPGARIRVRIPAHDVILSRGRPTGLSAQNILPVRVKRLVPGEGPGVVVHLAVGDEEMLARITRRSALAMSLASGDDIFAILKSMSVARDNVAPAPADGP